MATPRSTSTKRTLALKKRNPPTRNDPAQEMAQSSSPTTAMMADESRRRMIAEGAYYRAEKRGFAPGCELEDWLAAEAEIDTSTSAEQKSAHAELH